jgi:hypothetical protein
VGNQACDNSEPTKTISALIETSVKNSEAAEMTRELVKISRENVQGFGGILSNFLHRRNSARYCNFASSKAANPNCAAAWLPRLDESIRRLFDSTDAVPAP